jgi:hypothetical protein
MSRDIVVTSWSPDGYRLYGSRFLKRFAKYWPESIPLVLYADAPAVHDGCEVRYTKDIPDWSDLSARWQRDPAVHGWSTDECPREKDHSYLWDAARFAVKVFVWRDAARQLGKGTLTWLDGDTETHARVHKQWPGQLLGDADVAYLGREPMHPETGYVGFRVPEALPLLNWCCEVYLSGDFRAMTDGWTDCHVFRAGLAAVKPKAVNLTPPRYRDHSHVWPFSPLSRYVDHAKGVHRKRMAGLGSLVA